jgi:hypothetical protein
VTFRASRTPVYGEASAVTYTGSNPYYVTVAHPALWYLWAVDDNGQCAEPCAVWTGTGNDVLLNEVGEALRARLWANKAGLEAMMRGLVDVAELRQVVYGSATDVSDWPAVLVHSGRIEDEYVAFPYVRQLSLQFQVAFLIPHEDEQTLLPLATRLAMAGMAILNQPEYDELLTDSGMRLYGCRAATGDMQDVQIDEKTWVAAGTLQWIGYGLLQDGI